MDPCLDVVVLEFASRFRLLVSTVSRDGGVPAVVAHGGAVAFRSELGARSKRPLLHARGNATNTHTCIGSPSHSLASLKRRTGHPHSHAVFLCSLPTAPHAVAGGPRSLTVSSRGLRPVSLADADVGGASSEVCWMDSLSRATGGRLARRDGPGVLDPGPGRTVEDVEAYEAEVPGDRIVPVIDRLGRVNDWHYLARLCAHAIFDEHEIFDGDDSPSTSRRSALANRGLQRSEPLLHLPDIDAVTLSLLVSLPAATPRAQIERWAELVFDDLSGVHHGSVGALGFRPLGAAPFSGASLTDFAVRSAQIAVADAAWLSLAVYETEGAAAAWRVWQQAHHAPAAAAARSLSPAATADAAVDGDYAHGGWTRDAAEWVCGLRKPPRDGPTTEPLANEAWTHDDAGPPRPPAERRPPQPPAQEPLAAELGGLPQQRPDQPQPDQPQPPQQQQQQQQQPPPPPQQQQQEEERRQQQQAEDDDEEEQGSEHLSQGHPEASGGAGLAHTIFTGQQETRLHGKDGVPAPAPPEEQPCALS